GVAVWQGVRANRLRPRAVTDLGRREVRSAYVGASRLREAALRRLGAAGGLSDAESLFGLLGDRAEHVRLAAVDGLGAFFGRFDGGPRERLERWHAGRVPGRPVPPTANDPALRDLADRTAERLTRMLRSDPAHRDTYHNALWHIPEVRRLLPALLDDPQGPVRATAFHLGERWGVVDFARRLELLEDPHPHVRQGAALAFMQLVRSGDLTAAERKTLRSHLERRHDDPDRYVTVWTAQALTQLKT
ncbi:HEAT repeat domain-containing protein, partial [Actinomadura fibrosa]|uniref:HEAT repeat domain-containing protein n=1 Tax=Actinomadura fibrosa TaxID=111802 RepID=UPI001A95580C